MKRTAGLFTVVATLLFLQGAAGQQLKPVTVEDLMSLASIIDVKISPDGSKVAYALSRPSLAKNRHEASIYIVSTAGGAEQKVAESVRVFGGNLPSPRLRWSSTGILSFLGFSGDKPQVFAVDLVTGQAKPVTNAAEGASAYEWSPDGNQIAYLTRDPMPADEQQQRKEQSFVTHVDAPDRGTRIAVQRLDGQERMLTGSDEFVESLTWSPDGKEIGYASSTTTGFISQYATRIFSITVETRAKRVIVDRKGMNSTPRYSPDGSSIAFVSSNEKVSLMAPRGLSVVDLKSKVVRNIDLKDAWVSDITWAPDGEALYILTTDGKFAQGENMFEQPVVKVWSQTGKSEVFIGGTNANYSPSFSADGRLMTCKQVEPRNTGEVILRDARGQIKKLTDINPELKSFALGNAKSTSWRSFDGMKIWGLLLTPPGYGAGNRLPLLVYCHGGPNGSITYGLFPQFMQTVSQVDYYPVEAMLSKGFAILFPMPRGGLGYGEAGQRMIINDWGGADYKDIMTGVDDLIKKGIADPDRLGVMGASYGGYMTNWIVTQTNRFKAASAGAGISDLADQYFLSDGGEPMAEYFKRPWEARDSYIAHSPLTFAEKVSTPLLLQHGERDLRVPIANAWKFYRALKYFGKTVEFDIHPNSSHLFYSPMQERQAMQRNLDWFSKWILNK